MIGRWAGPGGLALLTAGWLLAAAIPSASALEFDEDTTLETRPPCPACRQSATMSTMSRASTARAVRGQNLLYAVKMDVPNGVCFLNENSIDVEMSVPIRVERGPAMDGPRNQLRILRGDCAHRQDDLGAPSLSSWHGAANSDEVGHIIDEFDQTIPIEPGENGNNFVIIVGFELTEEELDYNRRPKLMGRPVPDGEIKVVP